MYDFDLTEEEELIRDTARSFADEQLFPAFRDFEKQGAVPEALAKTFAEMGFAGIEAPEDVGGAGLSPLAKALVLEALARGDAASAIALDGIGPALYPLMEFGGPEARALVKNLLSNPAVRGWVIVDNEENHFEHGEGRIRGEWPWVPADALDVLVIIKDGAALVITEGMEFEHVKPAALHAAGASGLRVDAPIAITLRADNKALARTLARLRVYASGLLVGIAGASLDYAISYTQERVAFGRPIAHHQGLAFLIAELAHRIDGARLALWRACWAIQQEGDPTEAAAAAHLEAIDIGLEMGEQGVQLLGGHGYVTDHPVEKWMREGRTLSLLWGGRNGALDAATAQLFDVSARVGFSLPQWGGA